jgi:hypothetical protein
VWLTLHSQAPQWTSYLAAAYAIAMSFGLTAFVASELRTKLSAQPNPVHVAKVGAGSAVG